MPPAAPETQSLSRIQGEPLAAAVGPPVGYQVETDRSSRLGHAGYRSLDSRERTQDARSGKGGGSPVVHPPILRLDFQVVRQLLLRAATLPDGAAVRLSPGDRRES